MADAQPAGQTGIALRHEQILDRFEAAWRDGAEPAVAAFLEGDGAERRSLLLALLQLDLEERTRRGQLASVETYLRWWPELDGDADAVLRLIVWEWSLRGGGTDERLRGEYEARFPTLVAVLRDMEALRPQAPREASVVVPSTVVGTRGERESRPDTFPRIPGFVVLGELGQGGMGIVYRARQTALGRLVALKVLRGGTSGGEEWIERFLREGQAVASLGHPNVIQVYESGCVAGIPYLAMELVPGGSLLELVRKNPLAPGRAAELVEAVAHGVQHAHDRGIIHRDLKPENILLMADGTPRVGDFGLARRTEGATLTQSGAILGTPPYMAPEQARGQNDQVGKHTDVYGLGAVLYHLLTGRPPFLAATAVETLVQVVEKDPAPPRQLNAAVPRSLEAVCLKCCTRTRPAATPRPRNWRRTCAGGATASRSAPADRASASASGAGAAGGRRPQPWV
jgi:serine/threonine-protein kinase